MRLYSGTTNQFIQDTVQNQITEKLKISFFNYFRYNPPQGEVNSWRNSLRALCLVFEDSNLHDHGLMLEYQLPLTSRRLDCILCGRDFENRDNALIIELKQWEKCSASKGENEVSTWVGGAERDILHPSVQVGQYNMYLLDTHTAFNSTKNPVILNACSYLHNYSFLRNDALLGDKFNEILKDYPLFSADDVRRLEEYIKNKMNSGSGIEVLKRVEQSKYRPSIKLMNHVNKVIKNKLGSDETRILGGLEDYILLDNQLIAYDKVLSCVRGGFHEKKKKIVIIKGGPGTGKSVIALRLLADLNKMHYNAQYATGSKSFTETLRRIVGYRAASQFKYFLSYADAESNAIDILIMDEAHRIREKTILRGRKPTGKKQIEELINAAKVSVFLIDDDQVVRPNEIGSVEYIKENAEKFDCEIYEYELEAQFRCNGSDAFVNWINNTLGIRRTANVLWDTKEDFDFKILDSPEELENTIREKVKKGFTGRVTAGFCWDWSYPNADGTLKEDVVIGDYKRPWNAKPDAKHLAPDIPKASFWAYDPNGINQVGCIYTAQGFEFDYVGVIFGKDLTYSFDGQKWEGHVEHSSDAVVKRGGEKFVDMIKNTYRVLLTRGMKGCYVYFMDKDTERFIRSRMEGQ